MVSLYKKLRWNFIYFILRLPQSFVVKYFKTKYNDRIYRDIIFLASKIGNKEEHGNLIKKSRFWDISHVEDYSWEMFYNSDNWQEQSKHLSYLSTISNIEYSKTHYYSLKEISKRDQYIVKNVDGYNNIIDLWIKTYGNVAMIMLSDELGSMSKDIFNVYDEQATEFNFWTTFISGSHAGASNAGLALHYLVKFLVNKNPDIKINSLKKYNKYLKRYIHHVQLSYDYNMGFASPHEGIELGTFQLKTATILGIIQKRLKIFSILDMDEIKGFLAYLDRSMTPDMDHHPSGNDSGIHINLNIIMTYYITSEKDSHEYKIANKLLNSFLEEDDIYYYNRIFNLNKVHSKIVS